LLKKETRILGISAPEGKLRSTPVIGVVFRGNMWVDGLTTCWFKPRDNHLIQLAQAILRTRQYSQLHAVILAREKLAPHARIDLVELSRRIKLPVIAIIRRKRSGKMVRVKPSIRHSMKIFDIEVHGGSLSIKAANIDREAARELFEVTCSDNYSIPEAVRISDLITKHLSKRIFIPRSK
jgi:endonuclease V-like protein UPF0215 family